MARTSTEHMLQHSHVVRSICPVRGAGIYVRLFAYNLHGAICHESDFDYKEEKDGGREMAIRLDKHRYSKSGVHLRTRLSRSLSDMQYSLIKRPIRLAYLYGFTNQYRLFISHVSNLILYRLIGDIKLSIRRIEKMSLCGCLPT